MTVDDGRTTVRPLSLTVLAAVILTAQIAVLIGFGTLLSLALTPALPPNLAALLGVLIALSPTLLDIGSTAVNRLLRHRESLTLNRRRRELSATGAAAVMTSLVRARGTNHQGEGAALLDLMKQEWQAHGMAVILYPANTRLVDFYRQHDAVIDDKADQRMIYDYQGRA